MESLYSFAFFRSLLCVIFAMALAACTTVPERPQNVQPVDRDIPFLIEARLVLRHQDEAVSVKIFWTHIATLDKIILSSPFGQQFAVIMRFGQRYRLIQDGKVQIETDNIDELTADYFGYPIPFAQLPAWLLGLPAREQIDRRAPLPYRVVTSDGWQLDYEEFIQAQAHWLPRKAIFSNGQTSVRFVIDRWGVGEQK